MGSEWEYTTLGECADWYSGGTPRKSCPDYWDGDIPWISAKSLKDFHVRDSEDCVTNEGLENGTRLVPTDAILFVVRGMSLKSEFRLGVAQRPVSFNQDIKAIVAKDDYLPYFLAYILKAKTAEILDLVEEAGHGTGVLPTDVIKNIEIPAINKAEQKSLVEIFKAIDDKIELNRKMNATLEAMAQALFKSWFVDFDPVIDKALATGNPIPEELAHRAEIRRKVLAENATLSPHHSLFPASFTYTDELGYIPEGWELATLSELLEVKYGKDHKKLADGDFPVYGSGGLMRHAESSLYKGESVLIPRKGTLSNILYLNEEFWTVDTMFYTVPKISSVAKFCYYHLKSLDFTSMNVGSPVPSMTTKVLNDLPIIKATRTVLDQFDDLIGSYFQKSEQNDQESQTLTKLRDTLLPKLISGELRIP